MPKDWTELTAIGQARRVRSLLPEVARLHGWNDWAAHLLSHGENTTFDLRPGSGSERFVVRVHRPGYHCDAEIYSELAWLRALRRDLDLEVPEPVPDKDGRFLNVVQSERLAEPRQIVVFRWLDGSIRTRRGPESWRAAARLMATLHQHAENWAVPAGFTRPDWSADNALNVFGSPLTGLEAESEVSAIIEDAIAKVQRQLHCFESPGRRLLLHADLHPWNLLFKGMETRPIDFDDACFGDPMLDLFVATERAKPEELDVFLEAYHSAGGTWADMRVRADYEMLSCLMGVSWLRSRSDHPRLRKKWKKGVEYAATVGKAYLSAPTC